MCQLLCTIFACIQLETSPYLKQLSPILRARRHACCWCRKWKVSTANCSSGFAVRRRAQQHLPDACRAHGRSVSHHQSRHQVTGGPRTGGHQNTVRPGLAEARRGAEQGLTPRASGRKERLGASAPRA